MGRNLRLLGGLGVLCCLWVLVARAATQTTPTASVSMVGVSGEAASYWPRWRGPSGQGLATDSGYVDRWSSTENVLWRTTVPGRGHSSPVIWKDRVFLTRRAATGAFRCSPSTAQTASSCGRR